MSKPAASPQTDLSSSGGAAADDAASIREAQMSMRRVVHTIKFVRMFTNKDSHERRMQSVANLLKEDAARPEPLIDLSLIVEGDESCVLFQLLRFFRSCVVDDLLIWDYGGRREAEKIMLSEILPEGRKLLCTFDPSIVDAATGNNVLHEVAPLVPPKTVTPWIFGLVELFIAHGVSVHTRNQEGRTPLLQIASLVTPAHTSTAAMRLLLTHGTDLNVQDNDGNSLLHLLVKSKALPMLEDLLGGDGVSHIDCLLLNSAGQTAADLAAVQLAQLKADGGGAEAAAGLVWLHRLVLTYQKTWTACSRPILQRCVEAVLVPDLAALVLGYVDGGGKPFPAPSPTSAQKSSEAAATAGPPPAQ